MTPQDIDNLQNAVNSLQQAVNGLAGTTGVVGSTLNNFNGSVLNSAQQVRSAGQAFQSAGQSLVSGSMTVAGAQQQAAQQIQSNSAAMAASTQNLIQQSKQALNQLTTSTGNLTNAAGAAGALGNALGLMGQKLGIPQAAAQMLSSALGAAANVILGQTQALLGARDQLNKLGGVGQQTANSLYNYAHAAGLHSDTIGRMINPIASLGPALLTLGRGAGDAQKAFMELVQVQSADRERFARIGVFQEEMMKMQGNYVAAQDAAGINLRLQNADMGKLRSASLEYIKNLYELSALTGEEVATTEKRMRAAREEPLNQIENILRQREAAQLREDADRFEREGNLEAAAQKRREAQDIENQIAFRNSLQDQLSGLPEFVRKGVLEMETREGVISPDNQAAYMLNLQEIYNRAKEEATTGKNAQLAPEDQAKILRDILNRELFGKEGASYQAGRDLEQAIQLNPQLREQLLPADVRRALAQGQADDSARIRKDAADQITSAMTIGADKASRIAAVLQEAAREIGQTLDKAKTKIPGTPIEPELGNLNRPTNATENEKNYDPNMYPGTRAQSGLEDIIRKGTVIDDAISKSLANIETPLGQIAAALGGKDLAEKVIGALTPYKIEPQKPGSGTPGYTDPQTGKYIPPTGSEILRKKEIPLPPTVPVTAEPAATPVTTPVTTPVAAPVTTPPATTPVAAPVTTPPVTTPPVTTPPATTPPSTTPPVTTPPAVSQPIREPTATPSNINFTQFSVETNIGNITVSPEMSFKIAEALRKNTNRPTARVRVKFVLDTAGVQQAGRLDNRSADKIIDNVAQQARIPILSGSQANTAEPREPDVREETTTKAPDVAELVRSGKLQADTPTAVASKIATPKTREGTVKTSLAKLIDTGVIDPKYLRGPQEIPENIITDRKGRKSADDANSKTRDTHGEGYGLDPKLLEGIVSLQRADFGDLTLQHITALNDYYHALNFNNSSHKEGRAVDFTVNKTPTPEQSAKIINILKGIGFSKVNDEYNNPTATTQGKHFHAEIPPQELPSLDMGGLVRGPKSGFPAMLHGNEMVIPLAPDSLLAELGKKTSEQVSTETKTAQQQSDILYNSNLKDDLMRANEMIAKVLTSKLDEVINKLDAGNQTSSKILRYSQV